MQHEVERGETLLAVDQFPPVVFEPLHHDRLEVVVPAAGILDVIEQPPDLVRAPAVAALVVGHEERALDLADQAWFKKCRAPGLHGPIMAHRAEWIDGARLPGRLPLRRRRRNRCWHQSPGELHPFREHFTAFFGVDGTVRQLGGNTTDLTQRADRIAASPCETRGASRARLLPADGRATAGRCGEGSSHAFPLLDTARWRGSACVTVGDQKMTID